MADITRKRGDTYGDRFDLTVTATGLPLELAGYSGFLLTLDTRRDPPDTTTQVYQLAGVVIGATSLGQLEFAPTLAQANRTGRFFYDIQLTDPAGRVRTVLAARYAYRQDITKA